MKLKAYQYKLPFKSALHTSNQQFHYRQGLILSYHAQDHILYSEAAPLPGFSKESLHTVSEELQNFRDKINDIFNASHPTKALAEFYATYNISASLAFALDSVAYQLNAIQAGKPIQQYLCDTPNLKVPVNTLGNLLSDNLLDQIRIQVKQGYQTIKFKIGRDIGKELAQLKKVRTHFPMLTIRLDANGAWPIEKAISYCNQFTNHGIEYCEEPIEDASPERYQHLSKHTSMPLAIDESLLKTENWADILPYTSYLIIKPMLHGQFNTIFDLRNIAAENNNKIVFTTSLESGIGRMMTAVLASGLGEEQTAHGLATGSLLEKDLYPDSSYINKGYYQMPNFRLPKVDKNLLKDLASIDILK